MLQQKIETCIGQLVVENLSLKEKLEEQAKELEELKKKE